MNLLGRYLGNREQFYKDVRSKAVRSKNYYWILTVIFSLLVFTFVASATQASLVAGYMAEKMHASQSAILTADSLRLCATAGALFLANPLYKRIGLRPILMISCALWTIPQFVFPFLPGVGWLYVFKILQGLNSFSFPLLMATILKWAPSRRHGSVSAVFNGFYISGACLGSVTVILAEKLGLWQLSSILLGLVALTAWLAIWILAEDRETAGTAQAKESIPDSVILKMTVTWLMVAAFSACNWVDQAVNTDLPVYAQSMGISVTSSGSLMILISAATLISSLVAGAVSDRVAGSGSGVLKSRVLVFSVGFLVCIAALIGVVLAKDYRMLTICSIVAMAGVSWSNGTFWAIPPLFYRGDLLNIGTGVCTAFSNLVCPVSTFVVGVLCGGNDAWALGWIISALVCLASMACGLSLIRKN